MKLTGKKFDTAADIPMDGVVSDLWVLDIDACIMRKVKEDTELVYFKHISGPPYGKNNGLVEFPRNDKNWYEVLLEANA